MSHITKLSLSLKNLGCVKLAATRLEGATVGKISKQKLFGKTRKVLTLNLPSFKQPIYIDVITGEVFNDNFGGRWGELGVYNKFLQLYASEVTKEFAVNNNYNYEEQALEDGQIRCTLTPKLQVAYAGAGGYAVE
jgi:hypothetical protein